MPGSEPASADDLRQRRAVLGLLADGLVIEDDAGDAVLHGVGRAEQHLAIVAAAVGGRLRLDRVEPLLDGARALVGRENALAGRDHRLRDLFERHCHRFPLQLEMSHVREMDLVLTV